VSSLAFKLALLAVALCTIAQTIVHLVVVLDANRIDTIVDLDRSNGLPDLVSTLALILAAAGAGLVARREAGRRRRMVACLASVLAVLTFADVLHDGPHPTSPDGWYVIALVVATGALLLLVGRDTGPRARTALVVGGAALVSSFLVNGLDRFDHWFERERGDPIAEYQIVAKEGLELLGWSLVALALWDEAFRRPSATVAPTARASRAPAPSRRRVA
jgi:hypothetical protein